MIRWVVERVSQVVDEVWVATDHQEIASTVSAFGGHVLMTSPEHASGTDRCAEAARILAAEKTFDVVLNIQGDEPFIRPEQITELKNSFTPGVGIATLARRINNMAELENPNKPKVVTGKNGDAIFFSRSVIPFLRGFDRSEWISNHPFLAHVGLYGYRKEILQEITRLPQGNLEKAESLEQLRWLENGYKIRVTETTYSSYGIDTPEDLAFAMQLF